MVERDDYDRAWEAHVEKQHLAARRKRIQTVLLRTSTLSGLILLGLGLLFVALGVEVLGVYDACFANPNCLPTISGMNFTEFFGILAVGILLFLVGMVLLVANLWCEVAEQTAKPPV